MFVYRNKVRKDLPKGDQIGSNCKSVIRGIVDWSFRSSPDMKMDDTVIEAFFLSLYVSHITISPNDSWRVLELDTDLTKRVKYVPEYSIVLMVYEVLVEAGWYVDIIWPKYLTSLAFREDFHCAMDAYETDMSWKCVMFKENCLGKVYYSSGMQADPLRTSCWDHGRLFLQGGFFDRWTIRGIYEKDKPLQSYQLGLADAGVGPEAVESKHLAYDLSRYDSPRNLVSIADINAFGRLRHYKLTFNPEYAYFGRILFSLRQKLNVLRRRWHV